MGKELKHYKIEKRRHFSNCVGQYFGALLLLCLYSIKMAAQTDYHPNEKFIKTTENIIDVAKAERIFLSVRDSLLDVANKKSVILQNEKAESQNKIEISLKLMNTQKNVQELIRSSIKTDKTIDAIYFTTPKLKKKKVKSVEDRALLSEAYKSYQNPNNKMKKDILKGKITPDILICLSVYNKILSDSIQQIDDDINTFNEDIHKIETEIEQINTCTESGWEKCLPQIGIPLPTKTVSTMVKNPYYRGNNYSDYNTLDLLDKHQQEEGHANFYKGTSIYKEDSYPTKFKYYIYSEQPQYKVNSETLDVYNINGQLVYVHSLTRNSKNEFEEIKRIVYLLDYQNNKYGIKSQSNQTQKFLNRVLGRERGIEYYEFDKAITAFGSLAVNSSLGDLYSLAMGPQQRLSAAIGIQREYRELHNTNGENFIKQLEKDHEYDFGYIYMIERVSNVGFRVVYLNKRTLQPSYCALITYKTSTKPYTKTFSAKLISMPKNIPSITQ